MLLLNVNTVLVLIAHGWLIPITACWYMWATGWCKRCIACKLNHYHHATARVVPRHSAPFCCFLTRHLELCGHITTLQHFFHKLLFELRRVMRIYPFSRILAAGPISSRRGSCSYQDQKNIKQTNAHILTPFLAELWQTSNWCHTARGWNGIRTRSNCKPFLCKLRVL